MECQACPYWRKIDTTEYPNEPEQGFCRLNPPTPILVQGKERNHYQILRLITSPTDECAKSEFVQAILEKRKK